MTSRYDWLGESHLAELQRMADKEGKTIDEIAWDRVPNI